MNARLLFLLIIPTLSSTALFAQQNRNPSPPKPRLLVLTDISTWEPDDSESLVRLLVHADLYEIEGLVFTTGWSLDRTRDEFIGLIHDAIDAYEKDLPNLLKRSGQKSFISDESQQNIGYWPSPDYLRSITVFGSKNRGYKFIGEGNNSPGSDLIIKLADKADQRPLWITVWGGGNTLAQAIWQVKQERSEAELKKFLHKIPTYTITDQDRSQKDDYSISSHQWMRKEFKDDLLFIWDEVAWKFQNGAGRNNWEEYANQIQTHGNLGKVYPKFKYGVEGDTPAFLHLMPNGLNDPLVPAQVGWGGYFEWALSLDKETYAFTNHQSPVSEKARAYEEHFYPATFNNFAARMDWANEGKGNRNPIVVINKNEGIELLKVKARKRQTVMLDASKSYDSEDDELSFNWWIIPEAGTYKGNFSIPNSDSKRIKFNLPKDISGKTIHVICEVTDYGTPNLTSYRRIIIEGK
ncbi:DUF1593 domain-containing protein [Algoriphagus persicinus]|uniref:DUF1593 domain-containing protein n=1 Tax=Algoriphagus persicinus TaxID=3108754 RepID=UPI002B3869A5|nr:DUF1593 domain-containing protein [Algoriphagus sp. E1-3-M2]MEB2787109.1 DUF1593 domain-containing protein [Algoriphagus sp. E1-3-M2]